MADYESGLPVRSNADGTDERLHVKIVDGINPAVNQATVDSDNNVKVGVYGDKPNTADVALQLSETGRPNPDGDYDGTDNTKPANIGVIAHDRQDTPADADQNQRITGKTGSGDDSDVHAMDVALHDEVGNRYKKDNPLPVSVSNAVEGADIVQDFKQASSVAKDASDTHTYSVTSGKTMSLVKIQAAGSGKIRVEVKTGPAASETTLLVLFNSTAIPSVEYEFAEDHEVIGGDNILIVITNLDNQPQDVYSLMEGEEY